VPFTDQELTMSKLARVVALAALLAAMSLGGTAHAQSSDALSQQAGTTQPSPAPTPTPTPTPTPAPTPTPTPTPTIPQALPVTVSSQLGLVGTTVKLTADLRGCTQPNSATGSFRDHAGARWPLLGQIVTGGRRFTAQYIVTGREAVGWAGSGWPAVSPRGTPDSGWSHRSLSA
jgi:hypothetical protein